MKKLLVTPRSFGGQDGRYKKLLLEAGYEVVFNPYGRIMTEEEMIAEIADVDGVIIGVDPLNERVLSSAPKLKIISKYGVGLDNVDREYCKKKGITVTITQNANAEAVADYAFALMLSVARRVVEIDKGCRQLDWGKKTSIGIYGKTMGLLGLGNIGRNMVKRARGFDMKILAYDIFRDADYAAQNGVTYAGVEEILERSDFISLHLPLTEETQNIIGAEAFKKMKDTAVIVNTARGGLIDEEALCTALKEKQIWGAGIDVFESEPPQNRELLQLENIVIGSHCAASTVEAVENMSKIASENVLFFFEQS